MRFSRSHKLLRTRRSLRMITEQRAVLTKRQRALGAAIERIAAAAERERRELSEEELAHIGDLVAEVATLTRQINADNDVRASPAHADAYRGHALARGPSPSAHESIWRSRTVCAHTGLSRATVWRLVKTGRFPKPIH